MKLRYFNKLDAEDERLDRTKCDKRVVSDLEQMTHEEFLKKRIFYSFQEEYEKLMRINKEEFERENKKLKDMVSRMELFKASLANLTNAQEVFQREQ